ncbi:hypothetical protein CI109_101828 [Kwoniella shandongensis]|uniref:Uncharacterized protein n=1 Tax=Kwoniella shandongensis TaxID=1734106 RepID=A0A5M6C687_9TREE|nr:uncharacterized protein CI109_001050 [Kwoniella shandongensis]KAA5530250.1 hypothetical protein CI109_001050 [Kwoniella shandongensis]
MQRPSEQMAKLRQLKNDVSSLSTDIDYLTQTLLTPPQKMIDSVPLNEDTSLLGVEKRPARPPSRLSGWTSNLKLTRQKSNKKRNLPSRSTKYDNIDETPLLTSAAVEGRRGSDDSDKTLVEPSPLSSGVFTAEELLKLLAGPISTMQRLTNEVVAIGGSGGELEVKNIGVELLGIAERSQTLLTNLQCFETETAHVVTSTDKQVDKLDLEMKTLMLQALIKKVQFEQDRLRSFRPMATPVMAVDPLSHPSPYPRAPSIPTKSGAAPSFSRNPFILQATNLPLLASQSASHPSPSAPIKITRPITPSLEVEDEINLSDRSGKAPQYSSFVANSQSSATWAMNVVRLGSFQASALFSPSPIAVRRAVRDETRAGRQLMS